MGNLAAGAMPRSSLQDADIYEPVANFQLCVWDDILLSLSAPCKNLTVDGNAAAGSTHFSFLTQVLSNISDRNMQTYWSLFAWAAMLACCEAT